MTLVPEINEKEQVDVDLDNEHILVLYNDDFNTFDFVIECLITICGHYPDQAEQCTLLVHYKGKCEVKTGDKKILDKMCNKLISKGLTAEVQ